MSNKVRIHNIKSSFRKAGIKDISRCTIQRRPASKLAGHKGYDEIRIDSEELYTMALTNTDWAKEVLAFAEPEVAGAYGKAMVDKKQGVRRNGLIARVYLK